MNRTMINAACGLAARAVAWWSARRTARMLEALDDALLADIGIHRADIPRVARAVGIAALNGRAAASMRQRAPAFRPAIGRV